MASQRGGREVEKDYEEIYSSTPFKGKCKKRLWGSNIILNKIKNQLILQIN